MMQPSQNFVGWNKKEGHCYQMEACCLNGASKAEPQPYLCGVSEKPWRTWYYYGRVVFSLVCVDMLAAAVKISSHCQAG